MITKTQTKAPVRAANYTSVESAREAVQALKAAGFSRDEISVVCSEEHAHEHFGVPVQETGLKKSEYALNSAAAAGLGLGAATILGSLVLSSGATLFAIRAFAGLAITGTLVSLFASRGLDRETTDFFEQSLQEGIYSWP